MKLKIRRLIFLLILFTLISFGQNEKKIDSLKKIISNQKDSVEKANTYATLYKEYLYRDHELAKYYADQELKLSQKIGHNEGEAMALYHIGVYYNNLDNIDSSQYYYKKALKIFEVLDLKQKQADVTHGLAILEYSRGNFKNALNLLDENIIIYSSDDGLTSDLAVTYVLKSGINQSQGNYRIALKEALSALKLYEQLDEPIRKADALGALAAAEFSIDNYKKSIEYNIEALDIYEAHEDIMYSAQASNDIGNTYYYLKQYDVALKFLEKSYKLSKEAGSGDIMATALGNMGKIYTARGEYTRAISHLLESLEITNQTGNLFKRSESLNNLGIVYNNLNKPKTAINYFDESIGIAQKLEAKENLRIAFYNKSKAFELLNDYQNALKSHKEFTTISDSVFNKNKQMQIEEMRIIYETDKKEQQIAIQQNEIELLNQQKRNEFLFRLLLIFGLTLALLLAYGIYQKFKRKALEKERLDAELDYKKKELTTHALHLAKKNEVLEGIKQKSLEYGNSENDSNGYRHLASSIDFDIKDDTNWENFSRYFHDVHKDFNQKVQERYPNLTANELRLMALLKMNLTSKEIANILNISSDGIKKARYRLRKKLKISSEDSLQELILKL